jgi:predicted nucleic acid-binding protein
MSGRTFIDTNVPVYAADESPAEKRKHDVAIAVLSGNPDDLVVSTQVLQEFYVTVTRKLRVPLAAERAAAAARGLASLAVVGIDKPLVLTAMDTSRNAGLSLCDALIIEAARDAGCERVLTEDLSHGQVIRGVRVENPFLAPAD